MTDWLGKKRFVKELYQICFCIIAFIPQDTISILSSIWCTILTTWFQHPNHLTNLTILTIQPINQINCPNQPNFLDHLTTQIILISDQPTDPEWNTTLTNVTIPTTQTPWSPWADLDQLNNKITPTSWPYWPPQLGVPNPLQSHYMISRYIGGRRRNRS